MVHISSELAWDITDWDKDADLRLSNIRHNFMHTFVDNGLALPESIICRKDQEYPLLKDFGVTDLDGTHIQKIDVGFGLMKLKVLPLERVTVTRAAIWKGEA